MPKARVMRRNEAGEMEEVDVEPQVITDDMAGLIGTQSAPVIMEVERGAIRRYAEAVGDPNPLYSDVEYARKSKYGEMICPPGFFGWPTKRRGMAEGPRLRDMIAKAGPRRVVDNGGELEFMLPMRAGDTLTAVTKNADIYEEVGRSGNRLLLVIRETTYMNQNGDVVAKSRSRGLYF